MHHFAPLFLACALALGCSAPRTPGPEATIGGECQGPGRYEAGKGDHALPCCKGLKEVALRSAVEEGDAVREKKCTDSLPLRVYACVEGSCGDGRCEAGESAPCACPADCSSAAWEEPEAKAP